MAEHLLGAVFKGMGTGFTVLVWILRGISSILASFKNKRQ